MIVDDVKVDPSKLVSSLKDVCEVVGIFAPASVNFRKDNAKIPLHYTFSDAKINDGDTI